MVNDSDIQKIKDKIARLDVKKKKVAKDIGISNVYLSYLLNGKRKMSEEMRDEIFRVLKIRRRKIN